MISAYIRQAGHCIKTTSITKFTKTQVKYPSIHQRYIHQSSYEVWYKLLNPESGWGSVSLEDVKNVTHLKKAIKKENENALKDHDAESLILSATVKADDAGQVVKLDGRKSLASVLKDFDVRIPDENTASVHKSFADNIWLFVNVPVNYQHHPLVPIPVVPQAPILSWEDSKTILNWIKQYKRPQNVKPAKLVSTFGSKFPLYGRESTLDVLWNGIPLKNGVQGRFNHRGSRDRNHHPIPFIACGPGTGKSRFLQEAGRLLDGKAKECTNDEIKKAFSNLLAINITYGSDTRASEVDSMIGGEASVAIRLLYEHFINSENTIQSITFSKFCKTKGISGLSLDTAIEVVCSDYFGDLKKSTNSYVLVLGIDEINILYKEDRNLLRKVVHAIGNQCCASSSFPFFVPIMAGTIQGPVEDMVAESTYQYLLLPLPLLTNKDVMDIGLHITVSDNNRILRLTEGYVTDNELFHRCIADIGGMARAVEMFYQIFIYEMKKLKNISMNEKELTDQLGYIDILTVMAHLLSELRTRYPFQRYMEYATPMLANAILELPVSDTDLIVVGKNSISYKSLKDAGILMLENTGTPDKFYVRVPYLWVVSLARFTAHDPVWRFWKNLLDPEEKMEWGKWGEFNVKFWALRLCLFSVLGKKTIKLKEFLRGADFTSDFPDVEIIIPPHDKINVCKLSDKYPDFKSPSDTEYNELSNINKMYDKVFLNAPKAAFDGFSYLALSSENDSVVLGCLQTKLTADGSEINQEILDSEVKKVKAGWDKISQANSHCILVILSNCHFTHDAKLTGIPGAIVNAENFEKFYGYTFAGRAAFALSSSKLKINFLLPSQLLYIPGVDEELRDEICIERKRKWFENREDLEARVPKLFQI